MVTDTTHLDQKLQTLNTDIQTVDDLFATCQNYINECYEEDYDQIMDLIFLVNELRRAEFHQQDNPHSQMFIQLTQLLRHLVNTDPSPGDFN